MKDNKKKELTLEAKITNVIITICFFVDLCAFGLVFTRTIPFYYLFPIIVIPILLIFLYYTIKYFILTPPEKKNTPKKEILYKSKKVNEINNKNDIKTEIIKED